MPAAVVAVVMMAPISMRLYDSLLSMTRMSIQLNMNFFTCDLHILFILYIIYHGFGTHALPPIDLTLSSDTIKSRITNFLVWLHLHFDDTSPCTYLSLPLSLFKMQFSLCATY